MQSLEIDWEFPPKAFAVGVSTDGVKWAEVFSTDSNVLTTTSLSLSTSAKQVQITMHEVRPLASAIFTFCKFCVRPMQSMVFSKGTPCMVCRASRYWRRACRASSRIVQSQPRAKMHVINISKAMWEIMACAPAPHCGVSCLH